MDLSISRKSFGAEDQSWLGSVHGTDAAQTVTVDVSTFTQAEHYPEGYLPSGLPLMITGTAGGQDVYGLYTDGGEGETNELAGFLFTTTHVPSPDARVGAAILEHGRVKTDRLPVTVSEAAQATAAGRIIFA